MNRKEYNKKYYLENKDKIEKKKKEYIKTPMGRACYLFNGYNQQDKENNREKGDLTPKWIVENIFSKPCVHCGESDWHKLGCNRLDNSKPHTMDNVEPCCSKCNRKLAANEQKITFAKKVYQCTLDGKTINVWVSGIEAARQLGYDNGTINKCCNNKRKTYKGYKWSYEPL